MFHEVPVPCINEAALTYRVPAPLIMAIIETEGGSIGTESHNANNTYDLGVMQINSSWASTFEKKGYTIEDVAYNTCKNVDVGTWILSQCLQHNPDIFEAIGDYHSHTPYYNEIYATKAFSRYKQITLALKPALQPSCAKEGLIC